VDRRQVVGFPSRLGESSREEIIERCQPLHSLVPSRSNFTQIAPEFDEKSIAFAVLFSATDLVNLRKGKVRSSLIQLG
jgi:hypothetical protein